LGATQVIDRQGLLADPLPVDEGAIQAAKVHHTDSGRINVQQTVVARSQKVAGRQLQRAVRRSTDHTERPAGQEELLSQQFPRRDGKRDLCDHDVSFSSEEPGGTGASLLLSPGCRQREERALTLAPPDRDESAHSTAASAQTRAARRRAIAGEKGDLPDRRGLSWPVGFLASLLPEQGEHEPASALQTKERTMSAALSEMPHRVTFRAVTAEDLMTANPVSLRDTLTLHEAVGVFVDRGISGAPVIDESGRPVGVLSQTDVLIHERETVTHIEPPEYDCGVPLSREHWREFQIEKVEDTTVRDLMTPAVFAVGRHASIGRVIEEMRELNVHRLFVVDKNGALVGVISALDVLRKLDVENA
jgi:CBS domain-containing protein